MRLPRPALATRAASTVRLGFTLIEVLVSILIIGILMTFLLPKIPEAIEQAKITASRKNLSKIYEGFTTYQAKFDRLPNESGVKFFGVLISKGVWENTPQSARVLTCPGVDIGALTIGDLEPEEWFSDLELVDGTYSAYAGRNCDEFPLRKLSGKDAWIATDNDPVMNFSTTTLVLYGDGAVETIEIAELKDLGLLGDDEEYFAVGPDSPDKALQKLSLD